MLSPEEFLAHFDSAERSVSRLESRGHTDVPDERPEVRAFLLGELPELGERESSEWTRMVDRHRLAGRPFRRVRVMDEPLTDYNRFMVHCGYGSAAIGEDVRYLARAEANAMDLPDHDFWVFDTARMIELRFTADGRPLQHDLITQPEVVARHEAWFQQAFAAATPFADYVAQDPTRAWPPVRLGTAKGT